MKEEERVYWTGKHIDPSASPALLTVSTDKKLLRSISEGGVDNTVVITKKDGST